MLVLEREVMIGEEVLAPGRSDCGQAQESVVEVREHRAPSCGEMLP